MPAIKTIFDKDLYWLSADEEYNPDFTFKYRTPHENPLYFGQLKVKVLRINNEFVGFTAYYLESKDMGRLLFVAVRPEFRGKRYGQQLIEYALNDMAHMGVKQVKLTTRPSNLSGQKLYKRVGFVEQDRDDTFVHFLYTFK
jgi:ribosomal protein S18 acetylase RimI-like enzyme